MKELIQAQEPYKSYSVESQSRLGNHGENRLASMPSVIVEVGFHTNASDAAALKDPVFRTAAMKGVEKGYRLNAAGKSCAPFKIAGIANATGSQGTSIPVKVNYRGYPQFPVDAKIEIVTCPSGWTCNGGSASYADNLPSPLGYIINCRVTSLPTAVFRLRTTLSDADGVATNPVEHNVTCTPAAQLAPGIVPANRASMSIGTS